MYSSWLLALCKGKGATPLYFESNGKIDIFPIDFTDWSSLNEL